MQLVSSEEEEGEGDGKRSRGADATVKLFLPLVAARGADNIISFQILLSCFSARPNATVQCENRQLPCSRGGGVLNFQICVTLGTYSTISALPCLLMHIYIFRQWNDRVYS